MSISFPTSTASPTTKLQQGLELITVLKTGFPILTPETEQDVIAFQDGSVFMKESLKKKPSGAALLQTLLTEYDELVVRYIPDKQIAGFKKERDGAQRKMLDRPLTQEDALKELKKIVKAAEERGASDCRVQADPQGCTIDFRINGLIQHAWKIENLEAKSDTSHDNEPFSTKLTKATFTLCENREQSPSLERPQYGQFSPTDHLKVESGIQSVRCSWLTTSDGSHQGRLMNMRFQRPLSEMGSFSQMGFTVQEEHYLRLQREIETGLIFAVGKMGHGKSTLLAKQLETRYYETNGEINMISIEDPVEYKQPFPQISINASYKNEERDEAFRTHLAALMRGDIDEALLPEIRDRITLAMALQFSATGHKSWSTSHVHSVFDLMPKIRDMSNGDSAIYNPKIIAGAVAQNLLPKICSSCSVPLEQLRDRNRALIDRLDAAHLDWSTAKTRNKTGCVECDSTGVVGRLPVSEFLSFDKDIMNAYRSPSTQMQPADYVREMIQERGHQTMLDRALTRTLAGEVDPIMTEQTVGKFHADRLSICRTKQREAAE